MAQMEFTNMSSMNITAILQPLNDNTNGVFFMFFMFAIFVIIFGVLLFLGIKTASMGASTVTVIFAAFFMVMGLLTWTELIAWGAIFVMTMIYQFIG